MHVARFLLSSTLWALVVLAQVQAQSQSYDFGLDMEPLTRRQEGRIIVGRLPFATNGSVPHRLEIRQMHAHQHQWDLFILALSMFQSINQSDPLSWYQVAGIHGVPFRSWNGVEPVPGANMSGYCTHSSVLFPTWHRPYLALVEQELFRLAGFVASMFIDPIERRLYQQAAASIRLPYWDWALPAPAGQTHLPDVFWHPTIIQYGPRGVQTIRNPLYSYRFHPIEEDDFIWSPLRSWEETKRAPAMNISVASPPSINEEVDKALLSKLPEIQQRLFVLFSSYKDFNSFGNKAWAVSQNMSSLDSIEAVHDIIHIYGGLQGHMTYVPLSSFDPLFFIHHVSMDRLIAMWQILNPTAWISPMPAGETSYTTVQGDIQTSKTPLTPFYIFEDGTFWDSDMARFTTTFGYAYADTDPTLLRGESHAASLNRKITTWFGSSSPVGLRHTSGQSGTISKGSWTSGGRTFGLKASKPNVKPNGVDPPRNVIINNGQYTEWMVNVQVNAGALDGSFSIHFYLGEMPSDCRKWDTPNEVGSVDFFTMRGMSGHASKVSGSLPLTSALVKMVGVGSLEHLKPKAVEPLLRHALNFRVCRGNRTEADPSSVEGLHIGISSADVEVPASEAELPLWGAPVMRFELKA